MTLRPRHVLLSLALATCATACSSPSSDATAGGPDASVDAHRAVAAAPTAEALLALERKANEAFIIGDGHHFEGMLSDRFVMQSNGARVSKADLVGMISGIKCDVSPGWAFTDPQMLRINDDAYVLSYVSNMEGSCTGAVRTEALPSPVRAATVWVRNGDTWQTAFHGENRIIDLAAAPATTGAKTPDQDDETPADDDTAGASPPATPAADAITKTLLAAETTLWDAWKNKDAGKITALTANDISFVDLFGTFTAHKADTLKAWTGPLCKVTGFELTKAVGTEVSPSVGILTVTGTVTGDCGGQDISGSKIRANTVYLNDGGDWKWVFGFNSPA